MKKLLAVIAGMALLLGVIDFALAEGAQMKDKAAPKFQTLCPVTGDAISKDVFVDHEGKRIYFCCDMCIPTFKKDPAVYLKKIEEKGETPYSLQTMDPVNGEKTKKDVFIDKDGMRIYFSGADSRAAFEKSPDQYMKKMDAAGIVCELTSPPKESSGMKGM
jgi:YHS domain-containing protein